MSRQRAKHWIPEASTFAISIYRPEDGPGIEVGDTRYENVLHLCFDDILESGIGEYTSKGRKLIAFSDQMAEQVWAIMEIHRPQHWLVHCAAGISRSVAIGECIAQYKGGTLVLHEIGSTDLANGLIRRQMNKRYWMFREGN
jgi:predicted protein tyrosine phosphatase